MLVMTAAVLAAASPACGQTLDEVLAVVYETNPVIRAERARQEATSEAPKQARAAILPQISVDSSYSDSHNDQIVNSDLFGQVVDENREFDLNPGIVAVSAQQTVFQGFRNINRIKQARARVRSGDAQLRITEQQVLLQAATVYFDVQRDMEIYQANKSNVDVLMEKLSQAEKQLRYGDITKTDVDQARARLAGATAELSEAQARLSTSRAGFERVLGDAPGTLQKVDSPPELPATEEEAQALALELAPLLQFVREQEAVSRRQIAIERGSFAPSISFNTYYKYSDEPNSFIVRDEEFSYGVRASIPIFNGGLNYSKTREAVALNKSDKSRIIAAERDVRASVSAAWNQLVAARARITAAETQVHANENALSGVRREAAAGVRTTLDVLNAEQETLNSKVALASARRDELVAAFTLLAAVGAPIGIETDRAPEDHADYVAPAVEPVMSETGDARRGGLVMTEAAASPETLVPRVEMPERQPAPQPVAVTTAAGAEAGHTYYAQLGSYYSDEDARRALDAALQSNEQGLKSAAQTFGAAVEPALVDGVAYYRVRTGPMPYSEASSLCRGLSLDCIVINSP